MPDKFTPRASKKDEALRLAKQGIAVFPVRANGKTPATPNGFKDATTDLEQIERWWNENPDYNIGVPTGPRNGFDVLDIDPRSGGDQSWGALIEAHPELKESKAPFVKTPSGGVHFYFQHVDGVTISRGSLPPGIDVRGEGGYVLVPPSEIDGRKYEWGTT